MEKKTTLEFIRTFDLGTDDPEKLEQAKVVVEKEADRLSMLINSDIPSAKEHYQKTDNQTKWKDLDETEAIFRERLAEFKGFMEFCDQRVQQLLGKTALKTAESLNLPPED